jgi:hypothetical protein
MIFCACIWQFATIVVFFSNFYFFSCILFSSFFASQSFSRFIFVIFRLSSMKKKKRIVSRFFDDAKFNDLLSLNEANVNNEKISKNFEFDTKTNYDRILHLWNEWIFVFCFDDFVNRVNICWKHFSWVKYEKRNVDVNFCDLKTTKHFMKFVVRDSFTKWKKTFMYIML